MYQQALIICFVLAGVHIILLHVNNSENLMLFDFPQMPTQTKIKNSWNSGVQRVFSGLEQAPQAAWQLGTRGASNAKDFIKEQIK